MSISGSMPLSSAPTPLLRSLYGATDNIDGAIASGLGLMIVGLNPDKLAAVSEEIGFKHPKTEVCTFVLNFSEGPWLWMCLQFRPSPHHSVRSPPISTHPSSNRINLVVALKMGYIGVCVVSARWVGDRREEHSCRRFGQSRARGVAMRELRTWALTKEATARFMS
nr:uncharacterized protein LOC127301003 [Lolium perenne]